MKTMLWLKINLLLLLIIIKVKCEEKPKHTIYSYCNQFNTTGVSLDLNKVLEITKNQYVLKDFENLVADEVKLDYYIRFILASKGLCYYTDSSSLIQLDKWVDQKIRYARSTLCSYYYTLASDEESKDSVIAHSVCKQQCNQFLHSLLSIFKNQINCDYPNVNTMVTPPLGEFPNFEIDKIRVEFYNELVAYCNENQNMNCDLRDNEEVVNCGFGDEESKNEYCQANEDSCCLLKYDARTNLKIQKMKYYDKAIYIGISTSAIFIIIGSYFSFKFIKEIKIQESIKKSILNQEKEYQESTKQLLQDAYKNGYNPDDQVFNSSSRNLNTGTLRPRGVDPVSTMNSYGSSNRGTTGTRGTTMGRYPPNSYSISQDYQSSDDRDVSLRRGMIVQLIQKYEGGWVMVRDINSNRQGYAPEYCLGNKMS